MPGYVHNLCIIRTLLHRAYRQPIPITGSRLSQHSFAPPVIMCEGIPMIHRCGHQADPKITNHCAVFWSTPCPNIGQDRCGRLSFLGPMECLPNCCSQAGCCERAIQIKFNERAQQHSMERGTVAYIRPDNDGRAENPRAKEDWTQASDEYDYHVRNCQSLLAPLSRYMEMAKRAFPPANGVWSAM